MYMSIYNISPSLTHCEDNKTEYSDLEKLVRDREITDALGSMFGQWFGFEDSSFPPGYPGSGCSVDL